MAEDHKARTKKLQRTWMDNLIAQAQVRNWYGTLTIKVEHGILRRVVEEKSLIPPQESH